MKIHFAVSGVLLLGLRCAFQTHAAVERRHTKTKQQDWYPDPDVSLLRYHRRLQEEDIDRDELAMGKGKSKYSDSPPDYPSQEPSKQPTYVPTMADTPAPTAILKPAPIILPTVEPPRIDPTASPQTVLVPSTMAPTTPAQVTVATIRPNPPPTFAQPPIREAVTGGPVTPVPPLNKFDRAFAALENILAPQSYDFSSWQLDEGSYQFQALLRIIYREDFDQLSPPKLLQYWTLYCLFFSTGNGFDAEQTSQSSSRRQNTTLGWRNKSGWESANLDPCQDAWFGILCDELSQVTEIRLERNGLSGELPFEIVFLAAMGSFHTESVGNLRRLDVFANEGLTNGISREYWFNSLVGLKILNYRETMYLGQVPKLPSTLQEFDCSYCRHTGPIAEDVFAGLNVLVLASLDGNDFQSSVPVSLASLPNLKYLSLRNASIIGDLSYMERMASIVEHSMDDNPDLSGPLFSFIGSLPTLRSLSASDCSLTGTLPASLLTPNIVQLWLHGNKLEGTIPSIYSDASELTILSMEDNDLSGTVPFDLCLSTYNNLSALSVDCGVDCTAFFPDCCSCCGRTDCGT